MQNIVDTDYQILDAIDSSVYWKDISGKYRGCNKYMAKMAGLTRQEVLGCSDQDLPWKKQADEITKIDQLVINNKRKYELEETATLANGSVKTYLSSKSPLFDSKGNVVGVIGVSIDISHNKKFEQEFRKTEQALIEYSNIKTRFLKNISHEARIPLGSVVSILESLKEHWEEYSDTTKRENLNVICKEAKRLSQFVLNTFDMSNFLKNEMHLDFQKHNFSEFIRQVIKDYKKSFCNDKIDIQLNISDDYILVFDSSLIARVINNLLMNAIKYSLKKKKITINVYPSYLKNSSIPAIHCSIMDHGVGIPNDELDTVFNPFTESSRTLSNACGVGLGLSICREIVDAHSGSIWVENNNLHPGTTFHFHIPTTLLCYSNNSIKYSLQRSVGDANIIIKDLSKTAPNLSKNPFALIGISPFNSYFSSSKILEILEWVHNEYDDFAIFIPDQISKYTLEALGYEESRINQKTRKQDNYTRNKVKRALEQFYTAHPEKREVQIHSMTSLKDGDTYQQLYKIYSDMFYTSKEFRDGCLGVAEWVLTASSKLDSSNAPIEAFQKNIAVQYFLFELPVLINTTDIFKVDSCDFIYHSIPQFLKQIYNNKDLVPDNQRFLMLK